MVGLEFNGVVGKFFVIVFVNISSLNYQPSKHKIKLLIIVIAIMMLKIVRTENECVRWTTRCDKTSQ